MRIYHCKTCSCAFQVGGHHDEVQSLLSENMYPCVSSGCQGVMHKVGNVPMGTHMKEIPLTAFYRAIHGFGTPDGEAAQLEHFVRLLKTRKIVQVLAEKAGQPERVILKTIVLDNGVRLHFDASSKGACCYYIENPGPSCVEVVEDEIRSEAAASSGDPNREEAGRASGTDGEDRDEARNVATDSAGSEQPRTELPDVPAASEVPTSSTSRANELGGDS